MFGKPTRPETAPLHTFAGVLIAMVLTYVVVFGGELLSGSHVLDFGYITNLALIGIVVMGYGWYENRGK